MHVLMHNSLWCVCGFAEPGRLCAAASEVVQQWRLAGPVPGLASLLMVGAVHALLALKPAEMTLNPVGGDKSAQVPCFAHFPCILCLLVHNKVMATGLPSCVFVKHVAIALL